MSDSTDERIEQLSTVRDWLRYAVSRFEAAGLSYGHGTATALDEAAFLILETLSLPIDQLEPWLAARLLADERQALAAIIDRRIAERLPASYLTRSAYIQGHRFYVDERVIVPRALIGELLVGGGLEAVLPPDGGVHRVLDLCTGGGSLAILAALAFPDAEVVATDVSSDALAVARRNVAAYGLEHRVTLAEGDLFEAAGDRPFDLILSNPPYVPDAAVAAFPPEHAAEPRLAHAGGADGLDIVRRILADAARHLSGSGALVVEIGQAREALEASLPELPLLWLDTEETSGEVLAITARELSRPAAAKERSRRRRR